MESFLSLFLIFGLPFLSVQNLIIVTKEYLHLPKGSEDRKNKKFWLITSIVICAVALAVLIVMSVIFGYEIANM